MSNQSTIEKIKKLEAKRKSSAIVKLMGGKNTDPEVICAALESFANIGDEDALNTITHCMENENPQVRICACKAGLKIQTAYMDTRIRYQLSVEKDEAVKKAIQEAFNQR
ncbi:MAG: HEAT repeat domain-containing protein [Clostridia bacterium]|nr:HEAT repeat domain-containing protein [Clostridia bacterium]NCC42672.1 HEAT repeat domain-containing protein [Clostridia bacterium]